MFLNRVTKLHDRIPSQQDYPFSIPAIRTMDEIEIAANVTFFVGENGSGKSTLLEAIADKCEFNTAGGGRNNTYEVHASDSALGDYIRLSWMPKVTNGFFLRAESFYQFSSHLDEVDTTGFRDYGGKSLHHQSHGESFLSLFLHRFKGQAIYLLDEPEAALSPARQLAFLRVLYDLAEKEECQFIIATHSPILLGYPGADILSFDHGKISSIRYEESDHYQITRYFLENRERYLNELLKEEQDDE
ncbi:putative ATPase [Cytobacillus horneckiae]|uniref:AAA family ATPase n=1 Tax=Cytobacillus horneckiae TaxID=549687 RepID=A0A2N0ZHT6_9BACI|nr:AAA family ATPase [Cytobacillus horneckiae]NRG48167.1 AAA family ATPase [Bacillus sp. CRN 9]MBN6886975.1 AAA family ATPase [Cytobacillus horneckiae]MCM3177555.1 AAA family ATPase [Cytobacillus horneckiae]MEC1157859.1 AAA family ATPase [Cytobacillus horneckiae]MED2937216.1 AAA family ATPase [Cytobacillus horneckiae]